MSSRSGFIPIEVAELAHDQHLVDFTALGQHPDGVCVHHRALPHRPDQGQVDRVVGQLLGAGAKPDPVPGPVAEPGQHQPGPPRTSADSATAPPPSDSTATLRPAAQRRLTATQARSTASAGEVASQAPDSSHTARSTRSVGGQRAGVGGDRPSRGPGVARGHDHHRHAPVPGMVQRRPEVPAVERVLQVDDDRFRVVVVGQGPDRPAGGEAVLVAHAQEGRQPDARA